MADAAHEVDYDEFGMLADNASDHHPAAAPGSRRDSGIAGDHEQAAAAGQRALETMPEFGELPLASDQSPPGSCHDLSLRTQRARQARGRANTWTGLRTQGVVRLLVARS